MKRVAALAVTMLALASASAHAAGSLQIVTSLDPLEAGEYIKQFEADTGIKVKWIRLSSGEALARLKSESKNPTQDVWFGTAGAELVAARKAGLLAPYSSRHTKRIPEKWHSPGGLWTPIYFGAIAFISYKGVEPPKTWADLLDTKYKGEIVVSYPYTAGTGYAIFSGLAGMMGEDAALDYAAKLDRQVRRYTKSGGAPIIEVGLGEAGVGIVLEQDAVRKGRSRGFPIEVTIPSDGVPYEIGGVAMIAGAKNPDAAKKFMDWAVSLKAQNMMHKWYRMPLHPEAKIPEGVHRIEDMKLAPVTMEEVGEKREELIRRWREKVGK